MKIKLTKPFPQLSLGKVIPAGVIIDAPAGLSERLLRSGGATPAPGAEAASAPPEPAPMARSPRKKVKSRG
ncbi:MAG: hypothetical protein E7327_08890 [Clostridiales bacterium]|nr:hypothetical protein [Clostridiales bacterium]